MVEIIIINFIDEQFMCYIYYNTSPINVESTGELFSDHDGFLSYADFTFLALGGGPAGVGIRPVLAGR